MHFLKRIWSYVLGIRLAVYRSTVSGTLEVWLVNGRKVLNAQNVNYSFDSLHRVFQKAFRMAGLQAVPPHRVLILGFGAGSVAHILHREYGFDCHITGVDLDPLVFQIAEEHFGVRPGKNLRFVAEDAASFVQNPDEKYDLIVVDLFVDENIPDTFTQQTFLHHTINLLAPNGRLFMNFLDGTENGRCQIRETENILSALGKVEKLEIGNGNMVLSFVFVGDGRDSHLQIQMT